jgi:2-oxoglutarate ferredoxin oxidoreductase subunit beta
MSEDILNLLRQDRLPHILCEGCGAGTVVNSLVQAMYNTGLDIDRTVFVSGIGCSSRIPGYLYLDSLHTTHGRPLAFATGIKLANPELEVIVIAGDGDLAAIGGNHFLHAAKRNIDITTICINNFNYGMTGGQHSPTTPIGARTTTTSAGNLEPPLDISRIAAAAGANYVARWTSIHVDKVTEAIQTGLEREGFSLIEVVAQCPTAYGRRNKMRTASKMMEWMRENTLPARKQDEWMRRDPVGATGKIFAGVYADRKAPGLLRTLGLVEEEAEEEETAAEKAVRKEVPEEVKKARAKIEAMIERISSPKVRMLLETRQEVMEAEKAALKKRGEPDED